MNGLNFRTATLRFSAITIDDVQKIYDLRTNRKNNYLSPLDRDISRQYEYFNQYVERYSAGEEVYHKVSDVLSGELYGFVRITNLKEKYHIGWESLIVREGAPPRVGIEICFSVYFFTLRHLNRAMLGPWYVTSANTHMMALHKYMKFVTCVDSTGDGHILIVERKNYLEQEQKYLQMGFCNGFSVD